MLVVREEVDLANRRHFETVDAVREIKRGDLSRGGTHVGRALASRRTATLPSRARPQDKVAVAGLLWALQMALATVAA